MFSYQCSNALEVQRRRRDLNPCTVIHDLLTFQASPFNHLGTSPSMKRCISSKRRGWDSNPRALADKRFSRPPRYDLFDTSPNVTLEYDIIIIFLCQYFFIFCFFVTYLSDFYIVSFLLFNVNTFFNFFYIFIFNEFPPNFTILNHYAAFANMLEI